MKIKVINETEEKLYFSISSEHKVLYVEEIKEEKNTEYETNIVIRKEIIK